MTYIFLLYSLPLSLVYTCMRSIGCLHIEWIAQAVSRWCSLGKFLLLLEALQHAIDHHFHSVSESSERGQGSVILGHNASSRQQVSFSIGPLWAWGWARHTYQSTCVTLAAGVIRLVLFMENLVLARHSWWSVKDSFYSKTHWPFQTKYDTLRLFWLFEN